MLKTIFIIFGVILALIVILFILLEIFFPTNREHRTISVKHSPDNAYTAFLYVDMGGPAAGFCNKRVQVYPKQMKEEVQSGEYEVLLTTCSPDVEIEWKNSEVLDIKYVYEDNLYNDSKKFTNLDKKIKIEYIKIPKEELPSPSP